jgi:hypothetical protein
LPNLLHSSQYTCKRFIRQLYDVTQGPQYLPFLQVLQTLVNPLETLKRNARNFGDVYTPQLSGFGSIIILSEPKVIEAVMTACDEISLDEYSF